MFFPSFFFQGKKTTENGEYIFCVRMADIQRNKFFLLQYELFLIFKSKLNNF